MREPAVRLRQNGNRVRRRRRSASSMSHWFQVSLLSSLLTLASPDFAAFCREHVQEAAFWRHCQGWDAPSLPPASHVAREWQIQGRFLTSGVRGLYPNRLPASANIPMLSHAPLLSATMRIRLAPPRSVSQTHGIDEEWDGKKRGGRRVPCETPPIAWKRRWTLLLPAGTCSAHRLRAGVSPWKHRNVV